MIFVCLSISDLIEKGHDNIDHSEHACQRDIKVEVHCVFEGDGPSIGEKEENDDYC